jgi:hypothetical protein
MDVVVAPGLQALLTSLQCPICMDMYVLPRLMPCAHSLCLDCGRRAAASSTALRGEPCDRIHCPVCRAIHSLPSVGFGGFPRNTLIEEAVDSLAPNKLHCPSTGGLVAVSRDSITAQSSSVRLLSDTAQALWTTVAQYSERKRSASTEAASAHALVDSTFDRISALLYEARCRAHHVVDGMVNMQHNPPACFDKQLHRLTAALRDVGVCPEGGVPAETPAPSLTGYKLMQLQRQIEDLHLQSKHLLQQGSCIVQLQKDLQTCEKAVVIACETIPSPDAPDTLPNVTTTTLDDFINGPSSVESPTNTSHGSRSPVETSGEERAGEDKKTDKPVEAHPATTITSAEFETAWRASIREGTRLDAMDSRGVWCEAVVLSASQTALRVHFLGWASKWDTGFQRCSASLAMLHTHTQVWRPYLRVGSSVEVRISESDGGDAAGNPCWQQGWVASIDDHAYGVTVEVFYMHRGAVCRAVCEAESGRITCLGTHMQAKQGDEPPAMLRSLIYGS